VRVHAADMVEFPIVLVQNGRENDVVEVRCPGRKPLIEAVRPLLTSRLDLQSVERGQRIVIQLNVGRRGGVGANWSSPAERFAVSFYTFISQHAKAVADTVDRQGPISTT